MKQPLSVIIIIKDPKTEKEIHYKYDVITSSPKIEIIKIMLKTIFRLKQS
ncbi:MAG: hypothetical protein KJ963_02925 [Bacteroidetes bacterium]|nr:hypothetical protein [Bacteroidota bacterium]MDI6778604.1 hypothetical protein [Bacteroidota bacterium]